jgi:hypothetical protein
MPPCAPLPPALGLCPGAHLVAGALVLGADVEEAGDEGLAVGAREGLHPVVADDR